MTETTRDEVNQLIDAFAKVSVLYLQQQLESFRREQSETNQRLELANQRLTKQVETLTSRLIEAEKEVAWFKTALAKQESRIDAAGRYVKSLNGK